MKKFRSQSANYREDYLLNTSEFDRDAPGIHLHSFCHSFVLRSVSQQQYQLIQVSMILSGVSEIVTGEGERVTRPTNFFVIRDLNEMDMNFQYRQKMMLERYFILLDVNRLLRSLLNELFPAGLPQFILSDPARLKSCFEDIRKCLRKKGPPDDAMLGGLVFRLLSEAAAQNTGGTRVRETLSAALRYIDNKFCFPTLTREQVAGYAGISVVALGKLFRSGMGTTPGKYITALRLEKARHLLEFSELPVVQIAEQCGFSSGSYFTKVFREHMNCTALEYRLARRENPPGK